MINFQALCTLLNLGTMLAPANKVEGGLLHKMWSVHTTTGRYAVKELSPTIMLNDVARNYYDITENIADKFFDCGIPTIKSIRYNNQAVIKLDDKFFIVYPWVSGEMLPVLQTNESYATKMGAILAKMHSLKLQLGEFNNREVTDDYLIELFNNVLKQDSMKLELLDCYKQYRKSLSFLKKNMVVSHSDLDQKNVLWSKEGNPTIIDWESAHMINPTQEIICLALDWSGLQNCDLHFDVMQKILQSYNKAGGKIEKTEVVFAIDVIIGNWINWLVYNLERSERELGADQVNKTLKQLKYLMLNKVKIYDLLKNG